MDLILERCDKLKLGFLILISLILSSCQPSRSEIIESNFRNQQQAQPIIDAINQYAQDYAAFPEGLPELIPVYIQEVPLTEDDMSFEYFTSEFDGFVLCFGLSRPFPEGCCYLQEHQIWDCSPGH